MTYKFIAVVKVDHESIKSTLWEDSSDFGSDILDLPPGFFMVQDFWQGGDNSHR